MKMPRPSWRPTTGQLTTAAVAVVFLLIGFWIGWQHRSSTNPQTITPTVPRNMRTKALVIIPATSSTTTGTSSSVTTTTTAPTPAPLIPRSQVTVAVLNAGGRAGAAVQVAVTLVRRGYPTPYTGNVTLPPDLVPTGTTAAPAAPTTSTARTRSVSAPHAASTATRTGAAAPAALPEIVYFRTGGRALANRLASDLGVTGTAPMPSSGVIQAAAPTAQLVVVVGT